MRKAIPVLLLLLVAAACANARLNYVTAEKSFKTVVQFAVDQRKAGTMTDATYNRLDPAINAGNEWLKKWLEVILATPEGEKPDVADAIVEGVLSTIDILEAYFLQETR